MGFGHRVYKQYDPRAFIIKQVAAVVENAVEQNNLATIAAALEKAALQVGPLLHSFVQG